MTPRAPVGVESWRTHSGRLALLLTAGVAVGAGRGVCLVVQWVLRRAPRCLQPHGRLRAWGRSGPGAVTRR